MSVVLITGANSGIGAALAREYHRRGWSIGLVARNEERLSELARELGERVATASADVSDRKGVLDAVRTIEAQLGPTDLLIANAGIGGFMRAGALDDAAMDQAVHVLRVNLEGALNTLYAVLPAMVARGRGHVAAVSSLGGYRGMPPAAPYNASKAGLTVLMESMRIELARYGVAVTTIHPGFVDTPMTKKNRFPMPFMITVEDAAQRILRGLERRRPEINFPLIYVLLLNLARLLPIAIYDPIIRRFAPR